MKRELTQEEEQELSELTRKMLHSAPPMTIEDLDRHKELVYAKFGTEEDIREEKRQNRKNFLKLQEKLGKKVTK